MLLELDAFEQGQEALRRGTRRQEEEHCHDIVSFARRTCLILGRGSGLQAVERIKRVIMP